MNWATELGHAAAGMGMKPHAIEVGPMAWRLRRIKCEIKFDPESILSARGVAGLVPTTAIPDRMGRVPMIAGGPVANLMAGLLASRSGWAQW
jgi:hypothetical protein